MNHLLRAFGISFFYFLVVVVEFVAVVVGVPAPSAVDEAVALAAGGAFVVVVAAEGGGIVSAAENVVVVIAGADICVVDGFLFDQLPLHLDFDQLPSAERFRTFLRPLSLFKVTLSINFNNCFNFNISISIFIMF